MSKGQPERSNLDESAIMGLAHELLLSFSFYWIGVVVVRSVGRRWLPGFARSGPQYLYLTPFGRPVRRTGRSAPYQMYPNTGGKTITTIAAHTA
jgi:hypothetical protein